MESVKDLFREKRLAFASTKATAGTKSCSQLAKYLVKSL